VRSSPRWAARRGSGWGSASASRWAALRGGAAGSSWRRELLEILRDELNVRRSSSWTRRRSWSLRASHPLEPGDLEIEQTVSGDLVVESQGAYTAVLDPTITPELKREGLAREIVNRVQRLRKDAGLAVADRIALAVGGEGVVVEAARAHQDFIRRETLTVALSVEGAREGHTAERDMDLDGAAGWIALSVHNEGENGAD
jgi:hypothetical protein